MDIKSEIEEIIKSEASRVSAPIKDVVRKEVGRFLKSKGFLRFLNKTVGEQIYNLLEEDGLVSILSEAELNSLLKRAVKSVLKVSHGKK